MTKHLLVTGGTGFLGSHIVERLTDREDIEFVFSTRKANSNPRALRMDLRKEVDFKRHKKNLEAVEYLIHAAANVSHNSDTGQQRVIDGVKIIGNLMTHLPNIKRIIYISSCSAAMADTDSSLYGMSKLVDEEILKVVAAQKSIKLIILRFPQLYGPGETHGTFITKFISALQADERLELENDGAVSKDLLYIEDAVGSIEAALATDNEGIYTITPHEPVMIKEVLLTLEELMGVVARVVSIQVDKDEIARKSFHFIGNGQELGYNIRYTLRDGLQETIAAQRWR